MSLTGKASLKKVSSRSLFSTNAILVICNRKCCSRSSALFLSNPKSPAIHSLSFSSKAVPTCNTIDSSFFLPNRFFLNPSAKYFNKSELSFFSLPSSTTPLASHFWKETLSTSSSLLTVSGSVILPNLLCILSISSSTISSFASTT